MTPSQRTYHFLVYMCGLICLNQTNEFNITEDSDVLLRSLITGQETIMRKLTEMQYSIISLEERLTMFDDPEEHHLTASSQRQTPCKTEATMLQELLATDECEQETHNCSESATCKDLLINYKCSCLPGYSGDGFNCHDINECETEKHECHNKAFCINTIGSYSCRCKEPNYYGDGRHCDGPICESPKKSTEEFGCIESINEPKTWDDAQDYCRRNGGRLLENINSLNIREFINTFFTIRTSGIGEAWIGSKDGRWITSGDILEITENPSFSQSKCVLILRFLQKLVFVNCTNVEPFLCQFT